MFNYSLKVYSEIQGREIDFTFCAKTDKDAIKKASEIYFKTHLISLFKIISNQYLIIKKFN